MVAMENLKIEQNSPEHNDAIRTLFSVNGSNQLELIAIADNKANMITAICAALILIIIALFCLDISIGGSPLISSVQFVLPLGILLAFCCISAICAILALKPKIIQPKKEKRSVFFFNNYYRMTLEDYKTQMHGIISSPDLIYEHMLKNMYYNGLVLKRKYALLGFSYSTFLIAIVSSILAYVVATVI